MNHEQVSAEAQDIYQEHKQTADNLIHTQQRRLEAGSRLTKAARELAEARFRHDEASNRYLYRGGSFGRVQSLGDDRYAALRDHTMAESEYYAAGPEADQAQRDYSTNLQVGREHYSANEDAYHEQAVQEAHDAGVEVKTLVVPSLLTYAL